MPSAVGHAFTPKGVVGASECSDRRGENESWPLRYDTYFFVSSTYDDMAPVTGSSVVIAAAHPRNVLP